LATLTYRKGAGLTKLEKENMELVQRARDHGVYHALPTGESILKDAVNHALVRKDN